VKNDTAAIVGVVAILVRLAAWHSVFVRIQKAEQHADDLEARIVALESCDDSDDSDDSDDHYTGVCEAAPPGWVGALSPAGVAHGMATEWLGPTCVAGPFGPIYPTTDTP
jgi:hypothetical protein